ncbi:MAG: type IV pili twitching motility protein PilT [Elusimicrobia bacterium RIFOXYD2_FULL_34_15]|nr:MAG: type IV pili twitching motility protein PilT [Elusimicrobia bacterium RIFOXYD2_FULL_34_15]
MEIFDILTKAVKIGASDIHIVVDKPPMCRHIGEMKSLEGFTEIITPEESKRLIYSMLYDEQKKKFEEELELDCSFNLPNVSRFRVNVLMHRNGIGAVLRIISSKIPTPEQLKFSPTITELAQLPRGLVLVTGPTGSGKSTTLACLMDIVNTTRKDHILTVEDPIEFVYESKSCVVTQREVGQHTLSFTSALKHALREDPDIVLVGEMRDLETIGAAITIAETGHLVFATLHTTDAPSTIDRIIDVFPPHQQQQVRMQLSTSIQAVISQTLIPSVDGSTRVAAREIMIATPAIANLIREGKTHQLYQTIEVGSKSGMVSLDKALAGLVRDNQIKIEDALAKAHNPEMVKAAIYGR